MTAHPMAKLPVIHPQDSERGLYEVDVDPSGDVLTVILGGDLVLTVQTIDDGEGGIVAYIVSVCDGSNKHLHTLAETRDYPSDAVLAAAIATAKAAFPAHAK